MPGQDVLKEMYGTGAEAYWETASVEDGGSNDPAVIDFLRAIPRGVFVDYGCGYGSVLKQVQNLGWQALGFEFDAGIAGVVRRQTGVEVVAASHESVLGSRHVADVVYLGDVLEHLTRIDQEMTEILTLVKPGGYVIATGPLEGNLTLFNLVVRAVRSAWGRWRRSEAAPRHVMLATARGQRRLFQRFRLEEITFSVSEVSWPAPETLSFRDLTSPRRVVMFLLSRMSKALSLLNRNKWGNRYFYVGRFSAGVTLTSSS